jgi:hypothetical protein
MKIYCESDQSFSNDEQVYFTPLIDWGIKNIRNNK